MFTAASDSRPQTVLGPRFRKGASQFEIAQNLLHGIDVLIVHRNVERDSVYLTRARSLLNNFLEADGTAGISASQFESLPQPRPERHIITLGPGYAPEDPVDKVAADYLSGMADLIRAGRLDSKSSYVRETTEYLKSVAAGQTPAKSVRSTPGSRLEGEIEQALQLCFGVPR